MISKLITLAFFLSQWLSSAVPAEAAPDAPADQILANLKKGGCVIYIRHAQSDRRRDDTARPDFKDCSTQRVLSHEGELQANELGVAFLKLGIPVGPIWCSPYCRTRDTATRAFPNRTITPIDALARLARVDNNKRAACSRKLRELLAREPRPGENSVVVGHYENLAAVGGPDIDEGGLAVFLPDGAKYRLLGRLNPAQWRELVRATQAHP